MTGSSSGSPLNASGAELGQDVGAHEAGRRCRTSAAAGSRNTAPAMIGMPRFIASQVASARIERARLVRPRRDPDDLPARPQIRDERPLEPAALLHEKTPNQAPSKPCSFDRARSLSPSHARWSQSHEQVVLAPAALSPRHPVEHQLCADSFGRLVAREGDGRPSADAIPQSWRKTAAGPAPRPARGVDGAGDVRGRQSRPCLRADGPRRRVRSPRRTRPSLPRASAARRRRYGVSHAAGRGFDGRSSRIWDALGGRPDRDAAGPGALARCGARHMGRDERGIPIIAARVCATRSCGRSASSTCSCAPTSWPSSARTRSAAIRWSSRSSASRTAGTTASSR